MVSGTISVINCSAQGVGREIRRATLLNYGGADTEALSGAHAGLSAPALAETQDKVLGTRRI